jgi:hypothetical protein
VAGKGALTIGGACSDIAELTHHPITGSSFQDIMNRSRCYRDGRAPFGLFTCDTGAQVWYRSSGDGQHWTDPVSLTRPGDYYVVGAGVTAGRAWAIWQHDFSANDEDRSLEGAIR